MLNKRAKFGAKYSRICEKLRFSCWGVLYRDRVLQICNKQFFSYANSNAVNEWLLKHAASGYQAVLPCHT